MISLVNDVLNDIIVGLAHGYGHLLLGRDCLIYHQMHARTAGFRPSEPISTIKSVYSEIIELGDEANIWQGEPTPRWWATWNDDTWGLARHVLQEEELESSCV